MAEAQLQAAKEAELLWLASEEEAVAAVQLCRARIKRLESFLKEPRELQDSASL